MIVTKKILAIYDRYGGDFGILDERAACERDRRSVSPEQGLILGEFVDKLHFSKIEALSAELRKTTLDRIAELEKRIDPDVVLSLKKRVMEA
ncbi:MAG: hypothetical protein QM755_03850 [Luteolibacter sp.]